MEKKLQAAWEYADAHQDELAELIEALCAIPAPSRHEERRAEFCRTWLEKAGGKNVVIDAAQNVICPVGVTAGNDLVVFMAHTDTVFPDMTPMPFEKRDGRMYCPGVGDDTANVAVLMLCARYFMTHAPLEDTGVLFVLNACEEGLGNLDGGRRLMADYGARVREVVSFDGYMEMLCVGAVGSTRYKVEVKTEGGHSYGDFGNRNAIHVLSAMIGTLYTVKVPEDGDSKTTYNVGMISGGTSVNTIAQQAEMFYEFRSDSKLCLEKMDAAFHAVVEAYRATGAEVTVTVLGKRPGMGAVDPEKQKALADRASAAVEAATGKAPARMALSTDCNIPLSMGIPSVCFGTCRGGGAHTREEYIETDSLRDGFRAAMAMIAHHF
ncbi:M20/M25/M40 family metallo-hydrolase [Oscillospiraceae bacterium OttesenSCG-928-F05]|nr:M20/M25/M40 family metallo-hydrolase [Oscillospiraceae bacterium OttesenSCG-928-F05]